MAFEAQFPGECAKGCATDIRPHELIEFVAGRPPRTGDTGRGPLFQHVTCPPDPAPRPTCPRCFLELPATGVCPECE